MHSFLSFASKYQAKLYFPLTVNGLEACCGLAATLSLTFCPESLRAGTISQVNLEAWQRQSRPQGKDSQMLLPSTHRLTGPRYLGQGGGEALPGQG